MRHIRICKGAKKNDTMYGHFSLQISNYVRGFMLNNFCTRVYSQLGYYFLDKIL